jgi:hypothetical protein
VAIVRDATLAFFEIAMVAWTGQSGCGPARLCLRPERLCKTYCGFSIVIVDETASDAGPGCFASPRTSGQTGYDTRTKYPVSPSEIQEGGTRTETPAAREAAGPLIAQLPARARVDGALGSRGKFEAVVREHVAYCDQDRPHMLLVGDTPTSHPTIAS